MQTYYYIMFFILGLLFGSYFNVLGIRIPRKESVTFSRSHCENCNHVLKWYELIPILSFIIQKGKCSNCHEKLSFLYPFTEITTGLLYLVAYHSFGFSYELIIALTLISTFTIIIVSDLTYLIIPDRFIIIPCIIVIFTYLFAKGINYTIVQILYGGLAFSIMYLIMLLGNKLFQKESLGGADIKLMFLVGLTLDPLLIVIVLFLASIIALPVSLFLLIKNKEHVIPYGPFIMIGLLIVFFTKLNIEEIFQRILTLF